MAEPILLTTARVSTFDGDRLLTGASGFFFERDQRLFFVTSRHVVIDAPSKHFPNRVEIELHTDAVNLTQSAALSVWLYRDGKSVWRQGSDPGGEIDVAAIELDRSALPPSVAFSCFTPAHLQSRLDEVEVGSVLLVVGYPLGFHDVVHHLPVVRQAVIASSFGIRCATRRSSRASGCPTWSAASASAPACRGTAAATARRWNARARRCARWSKASCWAGPSASRWIAIRASA